MKPNLEDFPHHEKVNKSGVNQGKRTCYAVYEDWFEAFERHLREMLVAQDLEHTHPSTEFWRGWNKLLEEILGVEPKIKEETKR